MSAHGAITLRGDIGILPGEVEADGGASALLHDPVRSTFDRMEWPEYEIVRRIRKGTTVERLHADLWRETTIRVSREELERFVADLERRGFLGSGGIRPARELMEQHLAARVGWMRWLLGRYLYFRVPLLRPDAFLGRTLWVPRLLGGPAAKALFWMLVLAAAYLFLTRVELFFQSVVTFLSWKNAALTGMAVAGLKIAHEFSHAYAAKARGSRIAGMGVAFMVMFPLPYCDVTDSWRLPRRERLAISFAGVRTELILAILAFLGWAAYPPGVARDIFLVLCSGSLASTLLTNLNPGMRFDGYYLFSDLLGVDNLQQRAFAYFRRTYRRMALGIFLSEPEAGLSWRRKALMLVYTAYAWLYRMALYFGIAVAVYVYFPKVLGILLFAVEFVMFLLRPVAKELGSVWRMRTYPRNNRRLALTGIGLAALVFWLAYPLPHRIGLPAASVGNRMFAVYAPWAGDVLERPPERGGAVVEGAAVFTLATPLVSLELRRVEAELAEARTTLRLASGDGELRETFRRAAAGEKRLLAAREALLARLDGNVAAAPFSGIVFDADESLRPGLPIARGRYIATLADPAAGVKIVSYVPERHRGQVSVGQAGWFTPDSRPGLRVRCEVKRLASINSTALEEPFLAERHGGSLVTEPEQRALRPAETVYRLEAAPVEEGADFRFGQTGTFWFESSPRSIAADALRRLVALLIRESGF